MASFIGSAGSLNDINVLDCSSIFTDVAQGHLTKWKFAVNGKEYTCGYMLVDGVFKLCSTINEGCQC